MLGLGIGLGQGLGLGLGLGLVSSEHEDTICAAHTQHAPLRAQPYEHTSERPAGDGARRSAELAVSLHVVRDARAQCTRHRLLELRAARRAHLRDHRVQPHACQSGICACACAGHAPGRSAASRAEPRLHYLLRTTYSVLLTTSTYFYVLLTTYCLLLTTYYLLLTSD